MTILTPLKTLPLLAVLATGFAAGLTPGLALAGNHQGAQHKEQRAERGNANRHEQKQRGQYSGERREQANRHNNPPAKHQRDNQYRENRYYTSRYQPRRVVVNNHGRRHAHNRYYQHPVNPRAYAYQPHRPFNLHGLRLMLGLYSDNVDIVLHD